MEESTQADIIVDAINDYVLKGYCDNYYCDYVTNVKGWRSGFKNNIHLEIKVKKKYLNGKELKEVTTNMLNMFEYVLHWKFSHVWERSQVSKIMQNGVFTLEGRITQQTGYYLNFFIYRCN